MLAGCALRSRHTDLVVHTAGGPQGMIEKATREIVRHGLDDTFYMVDLANVLRMFKVNPGNGRGSASGPGFFACMPAAPA